MISMKQIRLKNDVRIITGCKTCPLRYNDGEYYEDIPACGLLEIDNDVIVYVKEGRGDYPPWCLLEEKE